MPFPKKIPSLLIAGFLAACQTGPRPPTPLQVVNDPYAQNIQILGIDYLQETPDHSVDWQLTTKINRKTGLALHELGLDVAYSSPVRHYTSAGDEHGNARVILALPVKRNACTRSDCIDAESMSIELSERELRGWMRNGFSIKLFAETGESLVLPIPADAVAQQLAAFDRVTGGK
jgi:hypothetical protein